MPCDSSKHKGTCVIFVGTACCEPVPARFFPTIPAEKHIWLDVSIDVAFTRALERQLNWLKDHQQDFLKRAQKSLPEVFHEYLLNYYSFHKRKQDWQSFRDSCPDYIPWKPEGVLKWMCLPLDVKQRIQNTIDLRAFLRIFHFSTGVGNSQDPRSRKIWIIGNATLPTILKTL